MTPSREPPDGAPRWTLRGRHPGPPYKASLSRPQSRASGLRRVIVASSGRYREAMRWRFDATRPSGPTQRVTKHRMLFFFLLLSLVPLHLGYVMAPPTSPPRPFQRDSPSDRNQPRFEAVRGRQPSSYGRPGPRAKPAPASMGPSMGPARGRGDSAATGSWEETGGSRRPPPVRSSAPNPRLAPKDLGRPP